MPDTIQSAENPGTPERRLHPRKQLSIPWIKLGVDNGGIILDISEGGLAMQAVRSLADGELPAMRFQLSESQTWIETPGRIAWIGASKHTAGVEFVGLPEEARNKIKQWIPLTLHPNGSAEEKGLSEKFEPVKDVLPTGNRRVRFSFLNPRRRDTLTSIKIRLEFCSAQPKRKMREQSRNIPKPLLIPERAEKKPRLLKRSHRW